MQNFESIATILQVSNLQERDRIVSFLTPELGQKRGVAQGARTKFSRFQGVLHSLAEVQVNWSEKAGRDLVRIQEVTLIQGASNRPEQLEQILVGQYFAESIERFTVENDSAIMEYRLLRACLNALRAEVPFEPLARYFEVWLLQLAGIFAIAGECPACGTSFANGAVLPDDADALLCRGCCQSETMGGKVYGPKVLEFVRECGRARPLDLAVGDARVLRQVEDLTREVRRRFLGSALHSYKVMQRTLAEVGTAG